MTTTLFRSVCRYQKDFTQLVPVAAAGGSKPKAKSADSAAAAAGAGAASASAASIVHGATALGGGVVDDDEDASFGSPIEPARPPVKGLPLKKS
jgi:hypothetical protein